MSGHDTYNRKSNKFPRRNFLVKIFAAIGILAVSGSVIYKWFLKTGKQKISGSLLGSNAAIGHKLRGGALPVPVEIIYKDYVIAGGGVAGLSAARWLVKNNLDSFLLLELEKEVGGNSAYGKNKITSYPWGAHYLPIPNNDLKELLQFLEESNVITGYDVNNLPIYNEDHLCFDPEERLYINGHWQDGVIPHFGVPNNEKDQIKKFLDMMEAYKNVKGKDGKEAFSLPLDNSSQDEEFLRLDKITMKEFLISNNLTSSYLNWFVDYSCRDDYGTNIENTSAWAGIHYFACRKGQASNADSSTVLTWPQGNAFLVEQLKKDLGSRVIENSLAFNIFLDKGKVNIDYMDADSGKTKRIIANKCILALPQFIVQRILKNVKSRDHVYEIFSYAPWVVANITATDLQERRGRPLSWDNVIYKSRCLGYVNAVQQQLKVHNKQKVFTYYRPLSDADPKTERLKAYHKTHEEWTKEIIDDLKIVHKDIEINTGNIDVWVWGHGMVRPVPGMISGKERLEAKKNIEGKIFFAHSDLSGISIFEEAFYQGIRASEELLAFVKKETNG